VQALDKMDKAGALGTASDRSKPVSWDGAALQVSTCCTLSAAEVVLPCCDTQYRALPWIHGFKHSVASSVRATGCGTAAVQITGCQVWHFLTLLTRFVWLQVNVGVNVFGRGETGTTTDQVFIEYLSHHIAAAARRCGTVHMRDVLCTSLGCTCALGCALYPEKLNPVSAGQRGRAGPEGHSDQPGAERRKREQTCPSPTPQCSVCKPCHTLPPDSNTLICVQLRPLIQQGRKPHGVCHRCVELRDLSTGSGC
jgi:hypothetical protein